MTKPATTPKKPATIPDADPATDPEYPTLPEDAIAEGYEIPQDHNETERVDFCRRFHKASPAPYNAYWRVKRIVDDAERVIGNRDIRTFDEGDFAEEVDAGDYVARLIVARSGPGVNKTKKFSTAKAFTAPRVPPRPPARTGAVETAAELDEMREQHRELLEEIRAQRERGPGRTDWGAIIPTCITAATGVLKMVMDNKPSTLELISMMDKRTGMGELAEAIKTMRDLASDAAPAGEGGSLIADVIASALPSLMEELRANREAPAVTVTQPEPAVAALPLALDVKGTEDARALLRAIVDDLLRGAQSPGADAAAYASVLFDRLEHAGNQGGAVGRTAAALVQSIQNGAVGEVAALLIRAAPSLAPYAEWIGEIEAEMRDITTPPEPEHEEEEDERGHTLPTETNDADAGARTPEPHEDAEAGRTEPERTSGNAGDDGAGAK